MSEDKEHITTINPTVFGVGAFYDVTKSFIVNQGTYIVAQLGSSKYMFELADPVDVSKSGAKMMFVYYGSAIAMPDETDPLEIVEILSFPVDKCRFPTKEELEIYKSAPTL